MSTPVGTWYLLANASRLELSIQVKKKFFKQFLVGTIKNEGGPPEPIDHISWDPAGRWLEFRRDGAGFYQWYRLSLTYGVVAGRFSHSAAPAKPAFTAYTYHVTGWSPRWLDSDIVPRTWQLTVAGANDTYGAVLRIDRDAGGVLQGRFKVFANSGGAGLDEELEFDLTAINWNGTNLSFTRSGGFTETYTGTAGGRSISGTYSRNGGAPLAWNGNRAEVLGFGLGSRLAQRDAWQTATRARIVNLTEGMRLANVGIPPVTVQDMGAVGPFLGAYPPDRDDDPDNWAANYTLRSLQFSVSPGSRFDPANPPAPRVFNGILATPTTPVPPGGFRPLVAVNGHGGSALQCLTASDQIFWYGESAARRGFIVLAVDIGHRPKWAPQPVIHPPVIDAGYADSNWEEDGERAFSVRRAIDWFLGQPNVRGDHLCMAGLSLGGEVTTITGGLDPRVRLVIPAGFSPDMHVMDNNWNHQCYKWDHADIHEYLDVSDWEALTAPRPLIVHTGQADQTFSPRQPPYSADKQVTRRARAAYGTNAPSVVHYLHYNGHQYHVGAQTHQQMQAPQNLHILEVAVTDPAAPGDQTWQTDGSTNVRSPSLYDLINEFLP